ncbi:MAG: cbb3-type cytochrome oxidase assembly protein CcoS [Chloroflexota bacterium]|nr:cbb3-type cytochrome oxidase assembly protein CcoS [Chloroflexota bacterium]
MMRGWIYGAARLGLACGLLGVLMSLGAPAYAHDNLGGDEMSMALTIFLAGMVTMVGAALAMWWAYRAGQFSNIEEAKYRMLDDAPDLDLLPVHPWSAGNPTKRP